MLTWIMMRACMTAQQPMINTTANACCVREETRQLTPHLRGAVSLCSRCARRSHVRSSTWNKLSQELWLGVRGGVACGRCRTFTQRWRLEIRGGGRGRNWYPFARAHVCARMGTPHIHRTCLHAHHAPRCTKLRFACHLSRELTRSLAHITNLHPRSIRTHSHDLTRTRTCPLA